MIGTNRPRRSLSAAASQLKLTNSYTKVGESWQQQLWAIYESLGPVHYGVGFKRNAAQKVTYFVAEKPEDGVDEPIPTENAQAIAAFDRLGSFPELAGELVVHINVAGEGYLVGQDRDEETWDVWSAMEVNDAKDYKQRRPDDPPPLTAEDVVIRIWRSSPYKRSIPDSSLRAVQAQCEQLLLLNEQIGATAKSRLPAGILLLPDELSFASYPTEGPDTGANMGNDPFEDELIQLITSAVQDASSAARVAPGIVRGPSEYLDKVRLMTFEREMDATFAAMREELLRMIAAGIDLPPEILLGKAELNHWSSWDVDESAAKLHVDPDVLLVIDGVTKGYLWPALEEEGVADFKNYMIWRDYSDLTSRPLSIDNAIKLRELGTISDDYLRRVANVPDDGAGDGVPLSAPNPESPAGPENVSKTPPAIAAAAGISLAPLATIDNTLAALITEATEAAFERAIERAGAIARAKARKDRQATALIEGVLNSQVLMTLGAKRVEAFQLTEDQLLPADTFDPLKKRISNLIDRATLEVRSTLHQLADVPYPDEPEDKDNAILAFIAALFAAASLRLFNNAPEPDPADRGEFSPDIATGQMVFDLLTAAGGAKVDFFTPETPRGFALGQRTRSILRDHGYRTESETWNYGDKSLRKYPFEPHVNLDGAVVEDKEDPRLNGYYPGDHDWCRCSWVPTVLPSIS